MTKFFTHYPCHRCGKPISNAGFANASHQRMHERQGWRLGFCSVCHRFRDGRIMADGSHWCAEHLPEEFKT